MELQVSRETLWMAEVLDQPGSLARELTSLKEAGASLGFVLARRAADSSDLGVVFLAPLKGVQQIRAARKAGFIKANGLCSIRVEGADTPGAGATLASAVAEAGINLRGMSASVIGRRFVCYLAFDTREETTRAARIVRKVGKQKPK
jgi:hypothetical protein